MILNKLFNLKVHNIQSFLKFYNKITLLVNELGKILRYCITLKSNT